MGRYDNEVLIQVKHRINPEWGIGNLYDVMPEANVALVAFPNVDTERYGLEPVKRNWYLLNHLEKVEDAKGDKVDED